MAVNIHFDYVEIFKFKETGALPFFDEVINFIQDESVKHGRRWEVTDIYRNEHQDFCARLERL